MNTLDKKTEKHSMLKVVRIISFILLILAVLVWGGFVFDFYNAKPIDNTGWTLGTYYHAYILSVWAVVIMGGVNFGVNTFAIVRTGKSKNTL